MSALLNAKKRVETSKEGIDEPLAVPDSTDQQRVPDRVHLASSSVHDVGEVRVDLRRSEGVAVRGVGFVDTEREGKARRTNEKVNFRSSLFLLRATTSTPGIHPSTLFPCFSPRELTAKKGGKEGESKRTWQPPKSSPSTGNHSYLLPLQRRCSLPLA